MYIVTAKEMYDIDHCTIHEIGIDGKLLMENAGREISRKIEAIADKTNRISILAGSGSNGGDGFVIARTLLNKGYSVHVLQIVSNEKITGNALYHKRMYVNCGGNVIVTDHAVNLKALLAHADIVVDAMVGIGVKGRLRETVANIVAMLNELAICVISIDIPSGLPADEGKKDFISVQADYTFVVGAPKISAFLPHTASFYGKWESVSMGIPPMLFQRNDSRQVWHESQFKQTMPVRKSNAHKGKHGKGLAIGGSSEMPGALALTVKAALRAGSGLITAGTSGKVIPSIASQCAEATYTIIPEKNGGLIYDQSFSVKGYDAIAIGVGMGRQPETADLVKYTAEAACPVIIDGDGLTHIKPHLSNLKNRSYATILTPHPGEMAMLLGTTIDELLTKPFHYAQQFAMQYEIFLVLKGEYTIITAPSGKQAVNVTGNPGLAKGGSGDVLTGIILAMVMQDQRVFQALCNACYIHGKAADLAVEGGHSYYDLMATDVIESIAKVFRIIS